MRMFRGLLAASLLAWLAGCNNGVPTSSTSPSGPTPLSHVVSGIVSETVDGVSRPLAGRPVSLWIVQDRSGRSQSSITDHNGRYTAQVPKSRVVVYAGGEDQQPCIASASVDKDTTINVQVFPAGRPATPPSAASPLITGFVYETTPEGRKPLRGATAWLDIVQDFYVANTETDEAGRFVLCRVDTRVRMDVFADGYQPYQYFEFIPGTGDMFFEFEFRR